jgi:hypothetical protein
MAREGSGNAVAGPAGGTRGEAAWFEALDELLDGAIDREEGLDCTLDDVTVDVPLQFGPDAPLARWHLDGTVRVRVEGTRGPLAEWLRWWHRLSDAE